MEKTKKKLDKTFILLTVVSVILVALIFVVSIALIHYINGNKNDKNLETIYGVVVKKGENYLVVNPTDGGESVMISTKEDYTEGSLIRIQADTSKTPYEADNIEVIVNKTEMDNTGNTTPTGYVTTTTNAEITTSTTSQTTTIVSTTNQTSAVQTTTQSTKALEVDNDTIIIDSVKRSYDEITKNIDEKEIKAKAKEYFITLVDFIFYDGDINGIKFNDLTSSAKAKVIYYTLLIDSKIDEKIPGYKDKLEAKYEDIKAKLVAKYLDFVSTICAENQDNCETVKKDFDKLKNVLSITWDFLKSVFKYCYDHSVPKIVEWYEIFSGKR